MQVDGGQQVHHISAFVQGNPVELHVLAGAEVAVADGHFAGAKAGLRELRFLINRCAGLVIVTGNGGQHPKLCAGEFAVRHGHAQHRGVALHIPAVLQAQWAEIVVGQRTGQIAGQLVTVLVSAGADELAVKVGVLVHGSVAPWLGLRGFIK